MNKTAAKLQPHSGRVEDGDPLGARPTNRPFSRLPTVVLLFLLSVFVAIQCLLPLRTAVKIGADEDFEPSKAVLCLSGYKLYTDVWDDQPPLHTFLVTQLIKHISPSIFGPRLLTVCLAMLLLVSLFMLLLRANGLVVATLTTGMLIASPGFLELSCSCMQEIPALAPAIASLCLLASGGPAKWRSQEVFAGILFAIALQLKFIGAMYFPLFALIFWLRYRSIKSILFPALSFAASLLIAFIAIEYLTGNSFLIQFQQSWAAHFSAAQSFEYGSPEEHSYDWSVLVKNWDTTIPAVFGVVLLVREVRRVPQNLVPLAWLALTMLILPAHRPWWAYYYVHNAVPLAWCAAVAIAFVVQRLKPLRIRAPLIFFAMFALCAGSWMGARLCLQVVDTRKSPRLYASLVLKEINRFKPFTKFLFTDQPIYSFHAQIPMPPHLAMISLKRLWSGDISDAQIAAEMAAVKPGLILLANDTLVVPFQDSVDEDYRLVYRDQANRLYVLKSIKAPHR